MILSRREVQEELRERRNIDVPASRVIVVSDSRDSAWWDEVREFGWRTPERVVVGTVGRYEWRYPALVDAAVLSGAVGFVGTEGSTYSAISRRRVETWHDGATRMLKWGSRGVGDH